MSTKSTQRGFTLFELLAVVFIILILGTVATGFFMDRYRKGQVAFAQRDLEDIKQALELLHADTGFYPQGDITSTTNPDYQGVLYGMRDICGRGDLSSVTNEIALNNSHVPLKSNPDNWPGWRGPYVQADEDFKDPWGTPYFIDSDFKCSTNSIGCLGRTDSGTDSSVLVSCGPDRVQAGYACEYTGDEIVVFLCDS